MRYLIIDIGSNTVKYDLFVCKKGRLPAKIGHKSRALRLINYITDGKLSSEGLSLLCDTLKQYEKDGKKEKALVFPFATASFRRISDPYETIDEIKKQTGLTVRLLSGSEEAECSFQGMLSTMKDLPRCGYMIDMGGGSTELTLFEDRAAGYLYSCPFGALSVKNAAGADDAIKKEQRRAASEFVAGLLPSKLSDFGEGGKTAVLVGGTGKALRTLAKELLSLKNAEHMTREDFSALLDLITDPSDALFEKMKELLPQRYQLMGAGLAAFDAIFEKAGTEEIYVCPGGVREGYLAMVQNAPKS
mgnify:CR=1 FL=1